MGNYKGSKEAVQIQTVIPLATALSGGCCTVAEKTAEHQKLNCQAAFITVQHVLTAQ